MRKILQFPNAQGEMLSATLAVPDGDIRAYALLTHCFTCHKSLRAAGQITQALLAEHIAVFRFDFTGLGESEGDFSNTNFTTNVADILSAASFMAQSGYAPNLLVGHSLGGTAALKAAAHITSVQAVVTIGSPASPAHVIKQFAHVQADILRQGAARVRLAGRDFIIKQQFMDDVNRVSILDDVPRLNKALLVFHAPRDATVGVEHAAMIFQAARHPKSYISLDDADHLLSRASDAHDVGAMIAVWVARYL